MGKKAQETDGQRVPATGELSENAAELYETDGYGWALHQVAALKDIAGVLQGEHPEVDWGNFIPDLELIVNAEKGANAAWRSNCADAIEHMLLILYARGERVTTWILGHWLDEVAYVCRTNMRDALAGNDGLKGELLHCLGEAWQDGRMDTIKRLTSKMYHDGSESERDDRRAQLERLIPVRCPWELGEVAGYNPLAKGEHPGGPSANVWPREVARRLSRELDLDYYGRGWTASGYPGYLEKRDGRPPDPRNLPPLTTDGQRVPAAGELSENAAELFEKDGYSWSLRQIAALNGIAGVLQGEHPEVDWENLIPDLEYVANRQKAEWRSKCSRTIQYLLLIPHARGKRVTGWDLERWHDKAAYAWRKDMRRALEGNDGLRGELLHCLGEAWQDGRRDAIVSLTGEFYFDGSESEREDRRAQLERLVPVQCPWELVEVAGYNPMAESGCWPDSDVLPSEVATRLNRELGLNYYDGGWTVEPGSAEPVKRDGRPPDPRNLPTVEPAQ